MFFKYSWWAPANSPLSCHLLLLSLLGQGGLRHVYSDICLCFNNACLKIRGWSQPAVTHRGQAVVAHTFDPRAWEAHAFNPSTRRVETGSWGHPFRLRSWRGKKWLWLAPLSLIFRHLPQYLTPISMKTNQNSRHTLL